MPSVRGQMRMCVREIGNRGEAANFVRDLDAMGVSACYFANVFEERGFFSKSSPTLHPLVGCHLCLSREDLFHVQVYGKQPLGLNRLGPDADHVVLQFLIQQW